MQADFSERNLCTIEVDGKTDKKTQKEWKNRSYSIEEMILYDNIFDEEWYQVMKWEDFYQHYDEWADSTIQQRISSLESYGQPTEIIDVTNTLDEKTASRFIRKVLEAGSLIPPELIPELDGLIDGGTMIQVVTTALDAGISFTPDQIIDLGGIVPETILTKAAQESTVAFTSDDILNLEGVIDDEVLKALDRKHRTHALVDYDEDEDDTAPIDPGIPDGVHVVQQVGKGFSLLAFLGALGESSTPPRKPR